MATQSKTLVLVDNIEQVDRSKFSRILGNEERGFVGLIGPSLVTCLNRDYVVAVPLNEWCCGIFYDSVQIAMDITIPDLTYLISRVKSSGVPSWFPELLKEPYGVILTKGRYYLRAEDKLGEGLQKLPESLTVEFLDDLAEIAAGYA